MRTLFVCAANVCRSPAAEALWLAATRERGLRGSATSAGLQARPGQPPSPAMTRLLLERGYVMPMHGSNPLFRALACRHELILVMEPAQQRQVVALAPELMGRVQLLGRWGQGPIEDPTGGPAAGYERCLDQLMAAVDAWMERLEGRQHAVPKPIAETVHA